MSNADRKRRARERLVVTHLLDTSVTTCGRVAVLLCALTFTGRGTSASGEEQ